MRPLLEELGQELDDEQLDLALAELDVDHSGEIEWEEFRRWWKAHGVRRAFAQYDADDSGFIDSHELAAVLDELGMDHDDPHGDHLCIELLSFASIPIVSVLSTYFHIWLALYMTFFPTKFIGCWQLPWTNIGVPFGWQGIVPWKGREMGRTHTRLAQVQRRTRRRSSQHFCTHGCYCSQLHLL